MGAPGWPVQGSELGNPWGGEREAETGRESGERQASHSVMWGGPLSGVTSSPKDLG